jgi:hypothetical protein
MVRLPLLVGTSCGWNATAAAFTLLPAIALTVFPLAYDPEIGAIVGLVLLVAITLPYIIYAIASLVRSVRARASDVVIDAAGIVIHGGPHHDRRLAWQELSPPFATVEVATEKRFRLGRLLFGTVLVILSLAVNALVLLVLANSKESTANIGFVWFGSPWKRKEITVWRLWIVTPRENILVGTTDREQEASSMGAAAESIDAVVAGRRYVEQAPAVPARIVTCHNCGAPVVPVPAPAVPCFYCGAQVAIPPDIAQQAMAVQAMRASRATSQRIVAKLVEQPRASRVNVRILVLAVFMFLAWPIGWALVAPRVVADGWSPTDIAFLLLPFAAVLAVCFFARAGLTDRGALQLLTLGFGALAPRRDGEPARCRRCQGPLPAADVGGCVSCAYCAADNVVGIDLRPTVQAARAEQTSLDDALRKRSSERTTWAFMTALAVLLLGAWVGGSIAFVAGWVSGT